LIEQPWILARFSQYRPDIVRQKVFRDGSQLLPAGAVELLHKIPKIRVKARDKFRPEAKSLDPSQRAEVLAGQFSIASDLRGQTALIVDDVFHSGTSMGEAARAARAAGANRVLGICAVRNRRR
jgi:predicted amidophosphoribosyltransferase